MTKSLFNLVFGNDGISSNIRSEIMKFLPGKFGKDWTSINTAIKCNYFFLVKYLIEEKNILPEIICLETAILKNYLYIIKYLIVEMKDHLIISRLKNNTLNVLVYNNEIDTLKYLIEYDLNRKNSMLVCDSILYAYITAMQKHNLPIINLFHVYGYILTDENLDFIYDYISHNWYSFDYIKETIIFLCGLGYRWKKDWSINFFTSDVKSVIYKNKIKYKNILFIFERLYHDGFDEYGPLSDIWSLYICYIKKNKIKFKSFHMENWYDGNHTTYE